MKLTVIRIQFKGLSLLLIVTDSLDTGNFRGREVINSTCGIFIYCQFITINGKDNPTFEIQ